MQYRKFGKLDWNASVLGFGAMRLPTLDGNQLGKNIDVQESIRMIRYAVDAGVNYVDTAYPYHGGNSEIVVGQALQDGYRQKVKLATKSPLWFVKSSQDFDKILNEQLQKLQTDHIDFYLFHGLDQQKWDLVLKLNLLEKAEAAVKDGRIGHIGFSFHDQYDTFPKIIDGYPDWDFCQIQYNYMDTLYQAGTMGLYYAASKGIPVIVMEPLLGGKLANPPGPIGDLFRQEGKQRTPADWALQWVWNHPQVSMVLSGMSSFQQLQDNLDSADRSGIDSLDAEDLFFLSQVRSQFESRAVIPCTQCGYCLPCLNGVNIPKNFELYNNGIMYDDMQTARAI
ncbi:MAG: aldo/keto reductase, partial [Firmicutes bacterium]|nr:aldo/keto reductase [Bacillota bacterium]